MKNEIWKDIEGFEGLYQVSNLGRVKSLNYNRTKKEKILKPEKHRGGYLRVNLYKKGELKRMFVHRLVAMAFIENPLNLETVNHKDENKENNRVDNLEWLSHKDNNNYGTRTKRSAEALSKKVLQFTLSGEFVKEWPSAMEAGRNGFHQGHVSSCCLGKLKSHRGYIWKYETPSVENKSL